DSPTSNGCGSTTRSKCRASSAFSPTARGRQRSRGWPRLPRRTGRTTSCSFTYVPHHGRPEHHPDSRAGGRHGPALAADLVRDALDALDPAAAALLLHRPHSRLDDRRIGAPALGHLRPDAHEPGLLSQCVGGECALFLDTLVVGVAALAPLARHDALWITMQT